MTEFSETQRFKGAVKEMFRGVYEVDFEHYHLLHPEQKRVFAKFDNKSEHSQFIFILVEGETPNGERKKMGVHNPAYAILAIGNRKEMFVFRCEDLAAIHNTGKYRVVGGMFYRKAGVRQYGMLLPKTVAKRVCISHTDFINAGASTQAKLF